MELEYIISQIVADILGMYGSLSDTELTIELPDKADDTKTYQVIELDPFLLEDGDELEVHQLPMLHSNYETSPGCHGITKEDDEGRVVFSAAIRDPSPETPKRVTDSSSEKLDIATLNELYVALIVATGLINCLESNVNSPLLRTSDFPVVVTDEEFENIIAMFDFEPPKE